MPRFPVSPSKEKQLIEQMRQLDVREEDIEEKFVRSSGAGGQNVNKVSTCVVLIYRPTGLKVKCQIARSQGLNRFLARRLLMNAVVRERSGARSAEQEKIEKLRRQKRRRSRRAREKILAEKKHQAIKKRLRTAGDEEYG
jgi:protein subunit release factor B